MMDCHEIEDGIIPYVLGELPAVGVRPSRGDVARHLAACRDCALESCRLQAALSGVLDAELELPREPMREALRRKIADEIAARPRWPRVWTALRRPIPVYSAALVGLVPLVAWGVIAGRRSMVLPPSAPPATISDYDATTVPAHRDVL